MAAQHNLHRGLPAGQFTWCTPWLPSDSLCTIRRSKGLSAFTHAPTHLHRRTQCPHLCTEHSVCPTPPTPSPSDPRPRHQTHPAPPQPPPAPTSQPHTSPNLTHSPTPLPSSLPHSFALGVYNKETGKLSVMPIAGSRIMRMEPRLPGLNYSATAQAGEAGAEDEEDGEETREERLAQNKKWVGLCQACGAMDAVGGGCQVVHAGWWTASAPPPAAAIHPCLLECGPSLGPVSISS